MAEYDNPDIVNDPEYTPVTGDSKVWLTMIDEAEATFRDYNAYCDGIEKLFADLTRLASVARDREMAIFWASIQIINPSIYAHAPVPVVVPRFKDRRPLYRVSSELLERSSVTAFDITDIDGVMRELRDDLTIVARGAAWVRYDSRKRGKYSERVCVEHINRRDYLQQPCREWAECDWVARRCWMTLEEMKERFSEYSGDAYLGAALQVDNRDKKDGGATRQQKVPVWELWCKSKEKVVWVTEGVPVTLDESEPYLDLEGFFPCPKPAMGTLQRNSMIPVPDYLQAKDQFEEINQLTNRIHALADALKVKGFYPAGGEIGDAVEAALNAVNDEQIMVPIANWAAFGNGGDKIIWLPIEVVAQTIQGVTQLRNEIINNVYQIFGIPDIQRGYSDPNETLGAQEIKSNYGSARVKDKQLELVRIARDIVRIAAEIMAEEFSKETLLAMSQLEIPTDADIKKQVKQVQEQAQQQIGALNQKIQQATSNPQMMAQAQQNPEQAQQALQQAQGQIQQIGQQAAQQIAKLEATPTIEQVMKFLRDNKTRCFVLDIETDSTIAVDEMAEKQARTEFLTALGGTLQQFGPVIQQMPQLAPVFGDILKFAIAPFRAGRELEGKIDEAVDNMTQSMGQQTEQPNPDAIKAQADAQAKQQEMQLKMQDDQRKQQSHELDMQAKQALTQTEIQQKRETADFERQQIANKYQTEINNLIVKSAQETQKHNQDLQKGALEIENKRLSNAGQVQSAVIKSNEAGQKAELNERAAKVKETGLGGNNSK